MTSAFRWKCFRPWLCPLLLILGAVLHSSAHEVRPALLDIKESESGIFDVTWKVPMRGQAILRISPVFSEALKPVGPPSNRMIPGANIQYSTYTSEAESIVGETIVIDGLSALQIDVLVQIDLADGSHHSAIIKPQSPSYRIPERETKGAVAVSYWRMGTVHILSGVDHLLFVLALVLIVSGKWRLFKTVTAFTVAHSITLGVATLGFVNVPPGPTEAIISLSIVFLAAEVVQSRQGKVSLTERYPWVIAFIFGLFHGLGFAGALTEVGLPQHEIPLALLMFNVGVESGQILFISVVLFVMAVLRRIPVTWPTGGWRVAPYAIGSLAAFWTIERALSCF